MSENNKKQILIDFGNTRIKWIINDEVFSHNLGAKSNNSPLQVNSSNDSNSGNCNVGDIEKLFDFIAQYNIESVVIACMRKTVDYLKLIDFIAKNGLVKIEIKIDDALLKPNYQDLQYFGIDRYLAMLGAKSLTNKPFCIIDAGSAITIDFFDSAKQLHLGGMISAGIGLQRELLAKKTGLLLTNITSELLGNDTQSCLSVGLNSIKYSINGLINDVEQQYQLQFQRFYTGGDAIFVMESPSEIFDNLVFLGMKLYLKNSAKVFKHK